MAVFRRWWPAARSACVGVIRFACLHRYHAAFGDQATVAQMIDAGFSLRSLAAVPMLLGAALTQRIGRLLLGGARRTLG